MANSARSRHPLRGDLYTPITPQVIALLREMRNVHGTWRDVAAIADIKLRQLRRIRLGQERKAISLTVMDRLITTTGVGSLDDFLWFTADDLVALGIWEKPAEPLDGNQRNVK